MTYDELTAHVQAYLENSEATFVARIPDFIKQTENDIFHSTQIVPLVEAVATGNMVINQNYITISDADFYAPLAMAVEFQKFGGDADEDNVYDYLLNKDLSFVREAMADLYNGSNKARPRWWAMSAQTNSAATITVAPNPDAVYAYHVWYHKKPASLVDGGGSGTTWISLHAEDALMWGTIMRGYIYMKGDQDVIQMYQSEYEKAMNSLRVVGEGRQRKDNWRTSDSRMQV